MRVFAFHAFRLPRKYLARTALEQTNVFPQASMPAPLIEMDIILDSRQIRTNPAPYDHHRRSENR
jgi:hypothetical protein